MIIEDLEDQIEFYEVHPPSALVGMGVNAIDLDFPWNVRPDTANSVFELVCRCGNTMFEVSCWVDGGNVTPPISVLCTACGYQHIIYDPNEHGMDAELGDGEPFGHNAGAYAGPLGADNVDIPHQVILRFEYPAWVLGDGEHPGAEHDLFTMITILAHDPESGDIGFMFEEANADPD